MLSNQEEEQERRAALENDRKALRERGSTYHQHGVGQADEVNQGRFAAVGAPRVIGSAPNPSSQYPAASAAHQTELPPEQPLGYSTDDIPGLENPTGCSSVSLPVEPGGAAAASLAPPGVERAAPPLSSEQTGE
jgi:hypothetical protein